ncbi:helix-turn-helix domain-containing protein [Bavariicoccus seileri]|uniref:AraC family transcriptional regulator n=1 Tax=Bavariicoccus seileri TaxID=549685 RepID=UPI003F920BCA
MSSISPEGFDPKIRYAFDVWNGEDNFSAKHSHEFFEASFILEGQVDYYVDHRWRNVNAGTILIFNPSNEHAEKQLKGTYSHQLHIGIDNFQLANLPPNTFPNKEAVLPINDTQLALFDKAWQLIKEFNEQKDYYQVIGKSLAVEIMMLLLRSLSVAQKEPPLSREVVPNERLSQLVTMTQSYIENNYANEISLNQLADVYYVSPTYLSKAFKDIIGVSPITYLIQFRLKKAYDLLKRSDYTVKEIAHLVGYQDAYHFSKQFKKAFDHSPTEARKQARSTKSEAPTKK